MGLWIILMSAVLVSCGRAPEAGQAPEALATTPCPNGGSFDSVLVDGKPAVFCRVGMGRIEGNTLRRASGGEAVLAVKAFLKTRGSEEEVPNLSHPLTSYCEDVAGGKLLLAKRSQGPEVLVCRFPDDSMITADTLYFGPEVVGYRPLALLLRIQKRAPEDHAIARPEL